jgi:uncharacterized protein (DUF302 family)
MTRYARPAKPLALTAATLILCMSMLAGAAQGFTVVESGASFDETLEALKLAIQDRGMTIKDVMHIGEMLERTGKDLGQTRRIYEKAESVQFCSAVLSREMAAEDPAQIANCPFVISVYTLPGKLGTTYLAYREVPRDRVGGSPAMSKVSAMLKEVAGAAAAW